MSAIFMNPLSRSCKLHSRERQCVSFDLSTLSNFQPNFPFTIYRVVVLILCNFPSEISNFARRFRNKFVWNPSSILWNAKSILTSRNQLLFLISVLRSFVWTSAFLNYSSPFPWIPLLGEEGTTVYCNFEKYIKMLATLLTSVSLQDSRYFSRKRNRPRTKRGKRSKNGLSLPVLQAIEYHYDIFIKLYLLKIGRHEMLIPCNLFLPFLCSEEGSQSIFHKNFSFSLDLIDRIDCSRIEKDLIWVVIDRNRNSRNSIIVYIVIKKEN